jgi:hypothetical protein
VAYVPRPFLLGFVGDDWTDLVLRARTTCPWSSERWEHFATVYLNRPVAAVLHYVFSSLFGDSAVLWGLAGVLVALLVAAAVRLFLIEVSRLVGDERTTVAELATAFWLLAPWTVGATAWAINFAPTLSAGFFALSGVLLLRGWNRGDAPWFGPALLLALSCFVYESFYGQFVVLLGLGAVAGVHRRLGVRALWRPGVAFLAVQAAAVAWNRFSPRLSGVTNTKSFDSGWYIGLVRNILLIPVALYEGAAEVFGLVALLAVVLVVLAVRGWRSAPEEVRVRARDVLAACATGAAGAVGILALAGYRLYGSGHDSRTTFGLSFWLAAMLVPLLILAEYARGGRLYRLRYHIAGLSLAALAAANLLRMNEWARAWQLARSTLAAVPADELQRASNDAVVLHVGPWQVAGVIPVAQKWAMSQAVWSAYPDLRRLRFYAARDFATSWDGVTLEQRPTFVPRMLRLEKRFGRATDRDVAAYLAGVPPDVRVPASELWVWDASSRRATRVTAPFTAGPVSNPVR